MEVSPGTADRHRDEGKRAFVAKMARDLRRTFGRHDGTMTAHDLMVYLNAACPDEVGYDPTRGYEQQALDPREWQTAAREQATVLGSEREYEVGLEQSTGLIHTVRVFAPDPAKARMRARTLYPPEVRSTARRTHVTEVTR